LDVKTIAVTHWGQKDMIVRIQFNCNGKLWFNQDQGFPFNKICCAKVLEPCFWALQGIQRRIFIACGAGSVGRRYIDVMAPGMNVAKIGNVKPQRASRISPDRPS
jgi:hypothetical protein